MEMENSCECPLKSEQLGKSAKILVHESQTLMSYYAETWIEATIKYNTSFL